MTEVATVNTYTAIVNLTADPAPLKLGDRDVFKLRAADNTYGKDNDPRFFDIIVSGFDMGTAERLAKGDQICVTGTLIKSHYKAKKAGKGVKKGQTIYTDSMPFGRILQVLKSPSFFNQESEGEEAPADGDESAPDLETEGDDAPTDETGPLEDIV